MNNDDSLVLDLDDGAAVDTLPDVTPFVTPRPKKPWLLLGFGVLIIILATYIIVRTIGGDSSSAIEVDLDAPAVIEVPGDSLDVPPLPVPAQNMPAPTPTPEQVAPAPVAQPASANEGDVAPVRVIEDRKPVTFNPDAAATAPTPVAKPAPKKPVAKPAAKPAPKPAVKKQVAAANGSWYVQLGSYSTRALAENAGKRIRAAHGALFEGHQFVVLAAVMKDGQTLYRLRVPFATSTDANNFCRNAKSDGVDCYVAK